MIWKTELNERHGSHSSSTDPCNKHSSSMSKEIDAQPDRESGHWKQRRVKIITRASEACRLVHASKWEPGWNMTGQIACKPVYSTWFVRSVCVIIHKECYYTWIAIKLCHLQITGEDPYKTIVIVLEWNCQWAGISGHGSFPWSLFWKAECFMSFNQRLSMLKRFWGQWPVQVWMSASLAEVKQCSLKFFVFQGQSGWHDEAVDCHSCFASVWPAKGVWLNSHSFTN